MNRRVAFLLIILIAGFYATAFAEKIDEINKRPNCFVHASPLIGPLNVGGKERLYDAVIYFKYK